MQKATPILLVLILALTAAVLSFRSRNEDDSGSVVAPPPMHMEPPAGSPAAAAPAKSADGVARAIPRPWPQSESDIPPDPRAIFGSLENGMRYVIYPNQEPPRRISLRLHIAAGSLMESEEQRGLAHFLEHMVFNGTRHYTAAELIPRMQRLGIAFGAHANAYTSFDETVYMLDLPDLADETLNLAFTVMRDFADGALLDPQEIDKERGVVLSEKISRDSVDYRLMEQQFKQLLPEALISRRLPIGEESVIKEAERERFVDFYSRYYTPQRMTFIVAGDIDPVQVRARIENAFSGMTNPTTPGDEPDLGALTQPEGIQTAVFTDKEVSYTSVDLSLVRRYERRPDNTRTRAERMPLKLAHAMMTRRFERISKERESPVASGEASEYILVNDLEFGSISLTAADDRWQECVPVLEQEFRRALEHGFTEAEFAEAKANMLNTYEQQVKQKATRKSEGIATVIARTLNQNLVFSAPETNLEIAAAQLAGLDAAACHRALQEFWQAPGYHLILTAKQAPANAKQELAALFEESRGKPVEVPAARAIPVFDYTDFGKPGTVASRSEIADLGITQLVLSNQVRVNLKRTDFEQGKIRLLARIGAGQLSQPPDSPMLDAFAQAIIAGGGLGKHSNDDLQQILAGRNVSASLSVSEDAFDLGGTTTPDDFTLQCQLMCAGITDPGYREEALWQFQKEIPMLQQQLKHTSQGPLREMEAWLHGRDARYSVAPAERLNSYTIDDARRWLEPELAGGYLELSIVGDFEEEKILPTLLATFGALPARSPTPPELAGARRVDFPQSSAAVTFIYQSKIPQAIASTVWRTSGIRGNIPQFRRLNLLAEIYGDRLREEIREKLGASYGPQAGASGSEALDNFGYLIGQSVGKPEDLPTLQETMRRIADELARDGANADEFERALKPTLGMLEKSLRDNNYWLNTVLARSQADPQRIELARGRDADYRTIRVDDINRLAREYLVADKALQINILPAAPSSEKQAPASPDKP